MNIDNQASDEACNALLHHVFGDLSELMNRLAPQGWTNASYIQIHHPTPEQRHAEMTLMYTNINQLVSKRKPDQPVREPLVMPTLEELSNEQPESPESVKPLDELLDVYGGCVWSIFSARYKSPPMIIQAYHDVYGQFPKGWVNE